MQHHRRQPTRLSRPWDSSGKNTGVGCHFLLQFMKVKRESEVSQLCPTLCDPMDCSPSGSSIHGIFQARVLEWGAIAFSGEQVLGSRNLWVFWIVSDQLLTQSIVTVICGSLFSFIFYPHLKTYNWHTIKYTILYFFKGTQFNSFWHIVPEKSLLQSRRLTYWSAPKVSACSFFFKKIFIYFYWGIYALQYCVTFCCTMKWINYIYTYIPSVLC